INRQLFLLSGSFSGEQFKPQSEIVFILERKSTLHNLRKLNRTLGCPVAIIAFLFCAFSSANAQTKLLRFPDISGDRVVFTYGGDLWTAPATGGSAIRL